MQIAVCCPSAEETRRVCRIIEEAANAAHTGAETVEFCSEDALWSAFAPGKFRGAVVGYGDVKGFLCARRLREEDKACRVDPCGDPGLEGAYIVEGDLLNEGEATGTPYVKHYHPKSDRYREDPDAVVDERGNVYKPVKP